MQAGPGFDAGDDCVDTSIAECSSRPRSSSGRFDSSIDPSLCLGEPAGGVTEDLRETRIAGHATGQAVDIARAGYSRAECRLCTRRVTSILLACFPAWLRWPSPP